MVRAKYEAMEAKLENLADKHELICTWDTESPFITLLVQPKAVEGEQVSFIAEDDEDKSSSDAAISFIFKNGEIIINTKGKLFITEALINKIKGIAKKMHYLYLQMFRDDIRGVKSFVDTSDDKYECNPEYEEDEDNDLDDEDEAE